MTQSPGERSTHDVHIDLQHLSNESSPSADHDTLTLQPDVSAQPQPLCLEDAQHCFLLDIPPELRVLVYNELLLYDGLKPEKRLYPQILATCEIIKREAEAILQSENFRTTILARVHLKDKAPPTIRHGVEAASQLPRAERIGHEAFMFKPVSDRIQRVVIELTIERLENVLVFSCQEKILRVRFQLYLLVTQAAFSANVKHVYFRVRPFGQQFRRDRVMEIGAPEKTMEEVLQDICLPLQQLGQNIALHVVGDDDINTSSLFSQELVGPARQQKLDTTALLEWLRVRRAVQDLTDVLTRADMRTANLMVLFTSLCGRREHPAGFMEQEGWQAEYDKVEEDLIKGARGAMSKLMMGFWRDRRDQAESRLAVTGS